MRQHEARAVARFVLYDRMEGVLRPILRLIRAIDPCL